MRSVFSAPWSVCASAPEGNRHNAAAEATAMRDISLLLFMAACEFSGVALHYFYVVSAVPFAVCRSHVGIWAL